MKRLWKSAVCAVAERYHYYCVTKGNEVRHLTSNAPPRNTSWYHANYDIVWCQGPQGGVRLVHYNWSKFPDWLRKYGYITRDEKAMQEFAWAKLQAKDIN